MQRVCRDGRTDTQADLIGRLCESEASLVIHFKDFLDGVDVGRSPQVQPQVVLVGCAHNLLGRKNKMEYYRFIFTKHFLCKISSTLTKHLWLLQQGMCWDQHSKLIYKPCGFYNKIVLWIVTELNALKNNQYSTRGQNIAVTSGTFNSVQFGFKCIALNTRHGHKRYEFQI